jgi:hypothetical protein
MGVVWVVRPYELTTNWYRPDHYTCSCSLRPSSLEANPLAGWSGFNFRESEVIIEVYKSNVSMPVPIYIIQMPIFSGSLRLIPLSPKWYYMVDAV